MSIRRYLLSVVVVAGFGCDGHSPIGERQVHPWDAPPASPNVPDTDVIIIDDFEGTCAAAEAEIGACQNRLTFPVWAFWSDNLAASNATARRDLSQGEGPQGRELVLDYDTDLGEQQWAAYVSYLRPFDPAVSQFLDASSFTDLVFEIRGDQGGEKLQVRVADRVWFEKENSISLGPLRRFLAAGVTKRMRTVRIPLERAVFLTENDQVACIAQCDQGDTGCAQTCRDDHPLLKLDELAILTIEPIGAGRVYVDNLRLERRPAPPVGDVRQRALDFLDRMRVGGLQREYDGDRRHPDFWALAQFWRVWAYTQGIALDNASRLGRFEPAYDLAAALVDEIAFDEDGVAIGWNFSWNTFEDAFRDVRVITGASSWALTGLGRYLASDLFPEVVRLEPERADDYRRLYTEILWSLLEMQRGDGLFSAGWSVADLVGATGLLEGNYEVHRCPDADEIVECHATDPNPSENCGSRLSLYYGLLICYGYPEVYFNEEHPFPSRARIPSVVTEHNLDMLATLQDAVAHAPKLGLDDATVVDLRRRLDDLRTAIFDLLYVEEDGRFSTGAGVETPGQRPWISPHTAIDNATWLTIHVDLTQLTPSQVDKLGEGLAFTNEHFVKTFVGYEGDETSYLGAHYFPPTFEDAFIDADPRQADGYHLEATTGLIQSLARFSNVFPKHPRSAEFAALADALWFDLRRFSGRHGFAYATDSLYNVSTTLESSTAAIWVVDTFDRLAALEPPECHGRVLAAELEWVEEPGGVYAQIDTSVCGYQLAPMTFATVASKGSAVGVVSVSHVTADGFRVHVPGAATQRPDWAIHWGAVRYRGHHGPCGGETSDLPWRREGDASIYVDVDTRGCDPRQTTHVVSLVRDGTTSQSMAFRMSARRVSDDVLRVSVRGSGVAPEVATERGWRVHWSAAAPGTSADKRSCGGRTLPGNTRWQPSANGISVTIDTDDCHFQSVPSYSLSLGSPMGVPVVPMQMRTATAGSIMVEIIGEGLSPKQANDAGWTIHWRGGAPTGQQTPNHRYAE